EPPTLLLRRTRTEVGSERTCKPSLEREPLALLLRLRRLLVERRGHLRRTAALGQAGHDDDAAGRAEGGLQPVARCDVSRRLDPLAAHLDVAGEDEVGRSAPRLRKARRP